MDHAYQEGNISNSAIIKEIEKSLGVSLITI